MYIPKKSVAVIRSYDLRSYFGTGSGGMPKIKPSSNFSSFLAYVDHSMIKNGISQLFLFFPLQVIENMLVEHGEIRSFYTDQYPECKPGLLRRKEEVQP